MVILDITQQVVEHSNYTLKNNMTKISHVGCIGSFTHQTPYLGIPYALAC